NLFFKTPIINIDHQIVNEHFGQINIIDSTKSSTAEILFEILCEWKEELIDAEISTILLSGIISQTKSFKADSIKPHTLATAGKLITMGADREKIIQNLYRTRTIPMLKLWGHALIHMQSDKNLKLVWSTLTRDDFIRCGAQENDLKDIIDELINNSPEAKITLLLHEHTNNQETVIHGILNTDKNFDAKKILAKYNPAGTNTNASFLIKGKTLKETEEEIVNHLRTVLKPV
ncbi:MAG: DHH family phosphoesterase, partial [Acidobacteriota bacterium]